MTLQVNSRAAGVADAAAAVKNQHKNKKERSRYLSEGKKERDTSPLLFAQAFGLCVSSLSQTQTDQVCSNIRKKKLFLLSLSLSLSRTPFSLTRRGHLLLMQQQIKDHDDDDDVVC